MIESLYPQFQHWSEYGAVWIISDPHLDDGDGILMNPNWPTTREYIQNLHIKVGKYDTLICLGDVGNPDYFRSFKCYKVLLTGNHDSGVSNYLGIFDEVYEGPLFIADRILLSHEPIYGLEEICINIHGHEHCHPTNYYNHINLAADNVNFEPFNLGKAIKNGLLSTTKNYHKLTLEKIRNS